MGNIEASFCGPGISQKSGAWPQESSKSWSLAPGYLKKAVRGPKNLVNSGAWPQDILKKWCVAPEIR